MTLKIYLSMKPLLFKDRCWEKSHDNLNQITKAIKK